MPGLREGQFTKKYRNDFSGGVNSYLGPRQIKDNESPDATNCDFKGRTGVGNREGYTEAGTVDDSRTEIWGMAEYHTSSTDQLIKFASNGSNVALYYGTGGTWTAHTTTTFTDNLNLDVVQAGGLLFSSNGSNVLRQWNGSSWAATTQTGGADTLGYYIEYYDKRLWIVDEDDLSTLQFSAQWTTAVTPLGDMGHANAGTVTIQPGSGKDIKGIKKFKDYLYIWTEDSIFRLSPASAANTFTVELVTNSIGCVSYRSIVQVGEDIYFAADDGVYSLGEVANYSSVRTTNKSLRVQEVFDALSGASKAKLAAAYHNFKYHLFYPQFGGTNDSCMVYDIRYQAWQMWSNIAANSAVVYTDSSGDKHLYFGEPDTGEVHELYSGTTDDGTSITSTWYSKSYDEDVPDLMKLYMDTTFIFGDLGGTVTVKVIFNDSETSATDTVTQSRPQGGFGRHAFGRQGFGKSANSITVTQVVNQPQRLKAKGKKFAVQYYVTSTGTWRLDAISQTMTPFGHYKFLSTNKLN